MTISLPFLSSGLAREHKHLWHRQQQPQSGHHRGQDQAAALLGTPKDGLHEGGTLGMQVFRYKKKVFRVNSEQRFQERETYRNFSGLSGNQKKSAENL